MLVNKQPLAARATPTALKNSADELVRNHAETLLGGIERQLQYEEDLRKYQERRKAAELAQAREIQSDEKTAGEPPGVTRTDASQTPPSTDRIIETATPQLRRAAGA